jgi:hypothetical protein
MQNYSIILDVWEGQLEVNEAELMNGGVAGLIIRLNDISGDHHRDTTFSKQWAEAKAFAPVPYFVYDPYVSGQANYNWLAANMPGDCPAVFVDTEVRKTGLSATTYGMEYNGFIQQCRARWKTIIYTGAWFLPNLAPWPTDLEYWWSAYLSSSTNPLTMYPPTQVKVSWENLKQRIAQLIWPPWNGKASPGPIRLWQCSGDRLIVPGSSQAMDINVFPGTAAEYRVWLGYPEFVSKAKMKTLPVPYVSQIAPGSSQHVNDDGAACTLMVLNAYNLAKDLTVDQVYDKISLTGDFALTASGLQAVLSACQVNNTWMVDMQLSDLFDALAEGRPAICLINYTPLVISGLTEKNDFLGAHYVVVVGMDIKNICIHDPYSSGPGQGLEVPIEIFKQAWSQCNLNGNPDNTAILTSLPIQDLTAPPIPIAIKYGFAVYNGRQINGINVRSGPGSTYLFIKTIWRAVTPIVSISNISGDWGQLADGSGWVYLPYIVKI